MAEAKLTREELFSLLVTQLTTSAWVQLGKIPDPVSGKIQRNLEAASLSIDILDVLAEKTRGNLTTEEQQLLDGSLSQLKLNYVEEMKKEAEGKSSGSPEDGSQEKEAAGESSQEQGQNKA